MSMAELAGLPSEPIRNPVFDLTGLKESFDHAGAPGRGRDPR
jgi:hypothetical protein